MLNVFEPCTLQLGDRNYYVLRDGDVILSKEQWQKLMAGKLMSENINNSACPLLQPRSVKSKSMFFKILFNGLSV